MLEGGLSASTRSQGFGGARFRRHFKDVQSPAWSLRYCELTSSVPETSNARPSSQDKSSASSSSIIPKRTFSSKENLQDTSGPSGSVFLVAKGPDQRVSMRLSTSSTKPSRRKIRRPAILAIGQSKIKVELAVKRMYAQHPEHMRNLNKVCEMKGKERQRLQCDAKELSTKEVEEVTASLGVSEAEVRMLFHHFDRYDSDDNGYLDRDEVRSVLADLGMAPQKQSEKVEVNEIICDQDCEGLRQFRFRAFVGLVKSIRDRLVQLQSVESMNLFEVADRDNVGYLDYENVMHVLESLALTPRNEDERDGVMMIFRSCSETSDGFLKFEEFQYFVQRVKEKILTSRREHEMEIAKFFQLERSLVNEFRSDLPKFWETFHRYDEEKGTILKADLVFFLFDVGFMPLAPNSRLRVTVEAAVEEVAADVNAFDMVLNTLNFARLKRKEQSLSSRRSSMPTTMTTTAGFA